MHRTRLVATPALLWAGAGCAATPDPGAIAQCPPLPDPGILAALPDGAMKPFREPLGDAGVADVIAHLRSLPALGR